ncbi:retrovirus-related Pol polyprotein from transposon 412 [Trichonephila clavipes]|uniref:RNA-directed DNA polymerase n=1 Tax=Trichonephila clavipes TaxID=2585209 RepID=A0A8X6V927_TRICX|nr:retrovirus-related Pol polyprotein from transposon 412 [Trichonephila clavipes]
MAQEVLGDLLHNGALVYIDDIILFIKTIDEHFELLGFVLTPEGILIDKDKSVSINEFPVPKDQKQIKSFLGCCNFYRRYIKNFAKRALPLTNLLRKDTPFEWTSETQEAFDDIKKAILNPPVLALPDQNAELQITTDASSRGIRAVLEQRYPNSEVKPLYFFSKKLKPSQSKYNATVLEFFAIYTALNFFRPFLLGRKFKVFTDHKPLAGFFSNKNPSSKILRWKLALEEFNYDIHYIRGSLNSVADHLSRYINNITIALPDSKDLINMQREDSVLSTIIQKIDQNDVSPQISNYFINGEGLLCHLSKRPSRSPRSSTTRKQVCIPHCLKAQILESVHSEYGGHLKFFKTYHRLSENFFWHNMYKGTKNFVRSCTICLSRKNAFKNPPAPHQLVEQSTEPGETCHMDIFGPLKTTLKEHGRDIRLSYTYEKNSDTPQNKYEYVEKLLPSLEHTFNKVLNNLKDQEASHVELSTRATKQHHYDYKIGSLCFIKTPNIKSNLSPKLRPKFEGPYRVIERFSNVNYRVQHVEQLRKRFNTHVNRMIPFIKRFSYLHLKNLGDLQPDETEVKGIVPGPRYNLRARAVQWRSPSTFRGAPGEDPLKWLKEYDRVANFNKWDDMMCLANVYFFLDGTARQWYVNNEDALDSWEAFKNGLSGLFGDRQKYTRRAEEQLKCRAQRSGESTQSYIQSVLGLCQEVNPLMKENEKVSHLMKGVAEDIYQALLTREINDTASFIKWCNYIEDMKQKRVGRPRFERLPNVVPVASLTDETDLVSLIRTIVREEVHRLVNQTQESLDSDPQSLEEIVQDEVERVLAPVSTKPTENRP